MVLKAVRFFFGKSPGLFSFGFYMASTVLVKLLSTFHGIGKGECMLRNCYPKSGRRI